MVEKDTRLQSTDSGTDCFELRKFKGFTEKSLRKKSQKSQQIDNKSFLENGH